MQYIQDIPLVDGKMKMAFGVWYLHRLHPGFKFIYEKDERGYVSMRYAVL